ncbi:hypothetical protein Zmor_020699 [Zophobas morio]|uniref:Uncharacterized protein n=1 Tax=Zophobas morio TaxID=2755281 RepID=A0AA38I4F1_9CUCU|nr:hypothetical protein Zmor_020699 [Zophobas morio]
MAKSVRKCAFSLEQLTVNVHFGCTVAGLLIQTSLARAFHWRMGIRGFVYAPTTPTAGAGTDQNKNKPPTRLVLLSRDGETATEGSMDRGIDSAASKTAAGLSDANAAASRHR